MVISGTYLISNYFYNSSDTHVQEPVHAVAASIPATANKTSINYSLPTRLQIPKIQVDSQVKYVGLTKNGIMDMPANVYDLGWYKHGVLPGNEGTAVIAGHLDGLRGQPGVFSNLNKLAKGDSIIVIESNGLSVTFVVSEIRHYPENAQPDEVFNSTSGSHLNLITCAGNWDSTGLSFEQRLVVFADKAP
ncbi:class F sortase [Candidatus Saccharibacteria bacterium]|nr:MAG: class F sortase [Candidatus Saccharibacteria bacterium]